MGLLRPSTNISPDLLTMRRPRDILPDTATWWSPFPFGRDPMPFMQNAMAEARFVMTVFISELNHLALRDTQGPAVAQFREAAEDMHARLCEWYTSLPRGLQYRAVMPAGLFEFQ